ncbi:hypothetical protein FB45DRAFT_289887 [Roridomyces roridus]|uniref:Uncharacterized protein n=1 Tax=Roridomyces roridus TaxID=1738132 RepID=A0AAD7CBA7_9AGAR|nr:hypothetical protein FB45DRAFT_289887 [Roridomyces roridus]
MERRQVPITPSASPAPFRVPDEAPPQKRQRRSSTPRHPAQASSATPEEIKKFIEERDASQRRMLDVWDGLAAKYSRPIDEDDIIDLTTLEIVKDRGVLSAETPRKIGRFADQEENVATDDDDEAEEEEEEEDDDVDELDAFSVPATQDHSWTVPPIREMDPADEKDLAEFMQAEMQRREACGDDDTSDGGHDKTRTDLSPAGYETDASEGVQTRVSSHAEDDEESDDELDTWDVIDASNVVTPVATKTTESPIERSDSPTFVVEIPTRKPQPSLQLQTPPPSRTPSSALDPVVPVALASPPSSPPPLPPPDSSPIKEKPKRVGRPARSQSRPRTSAPPKDPDVLPRLDLTQVGRGRSVRRSPTYAPATQSSPVNSKSSPRKREASMSSARAPGNGEKAKTKPPPSSPPQKQATSVPPSSPEQRSRASGKRDGVDKHAPLDPKGKSRQLEPEWDGVDDVDGGSSSYSAVVMRPKTHRRPLKSDALGQSSRSVQREPSPPIPPTSRKRKRSSSGSSGLEGMPSAPKSESPPSSPRNRMRRSASVSAKPRVKPPDSDDEFKLDPDAAHQSHQHPHPMFYPPPSMYPYPPYPPGPGGHPLMPPPDPRAQFIISQAVHQLTALYTSGWSAQSLSSPHHRSTSRPPSGSSPYSYPTTPHHPHTHPYVFDSGMSMGTLPPSSPPGSSPGSLASSPTYEHGSGRRSSLVSRSRSRGRRVNFEIDVEMVRNEDESPDSSPTRAQGRSHARRKDKGKEKMLEEDLSESEPETFDVLQLENRARLVEEDLESESSDVPQSDSRTKLAERARTPGPSGPTVPPTRRGPGGSNGENSKSKGKPRKG